MIPSCIEELITLLTADRARLSAQAQHRIFQPHRGRRNADMTLMRVSGNVLGTAGQVQYVEPARRPHFSLAIISITV